MISVVLIKSFGMGAPTSVVAFRSLWRGRSTSLSFSPLPPPPHPRAFFLVDSPVLFDHYWPLSVYCLDTAWFPPNTSLTVVCAWCTGGVYQTDSAATRVKSRQSVSQRRGKNTCPTSVKKKKSGYYWIRLNVPCPPLTEGKKKKERGKKREELVSSWISIAELPQNQHTLKKKKKFLDFTFPSTAVSPQGKTKNKTKQKTKKQRADEEEELELGC